MDITRVILGFLLLTLAVAETSPSEGFYHRSLMSDGRRLVHIPLQETSLYGNSTDMMYFYANVYVGSYGDLRQQSLIIDTGSGIMSFPCKEYCDHCGEHLNPYYPLNQSKTARILDCNSDSGCTCYNGTMCKFGQAYGEGSSYHGFWVEEDFYFGDP